MIEMASENCSNFFIRLNICAVVFFLCSNSILAVTSDEAEPDFSKVEHVVKPRQIRIYSKPPGENLEKQTGIGLRQHLDNALQGGSVGIEFNLQPLRNRWSGFMDKARNYLPLLYRLKKKPDNGLGDIPTNSPGDPENEKREDPEVDLKPRLDTSKEENSVDEEENSVDDEENSVDEGEVSMEFELDPRRTNLNPEEIVLLEREIENEQ